VRSAASIEHLQWLHHVDVTNEVVANIGPHLGPGFSEAPKWPIASTIEDRNHESFNSNIFHDANFDADCCIKSSGDNPSDGIGKSSV
jgi:hypothetical protein